MKKTSEAGLEAVGWAYGLIAGSPHRQRRKEIPSAEHISFPPFSWDEMSEDLD